MPSPEEIFQMLMNMNQSLTMLVADQHNTRARLDEIDRGCPAEPVRKVLPPAPPAPPSVHTNTPPPPEQPPPPRV